MEFKILLSLNVWQSFSYNLGIDKTKNKTHQPFSPILLVEPKSEAYLKVGKKISDTI